MSWWLTLLRRAPRHAMEIAAPRTFLHAVCLPIARCGGWSANTASTTRHARHACLRKVAAGATMASTTRPGALQMIWRQRAGGLIPILVSFRSCRRLSHLLTRSQWPSQSPRRRRWTHTCSEKEPNLRHRRHVTHGTTWPASSPRWQDTHSSKSSRRPTIVQSTRAAPPVSREFSAKHAALTAVVLCDTQMFLTRSLALPPVATLPTLPNAHLFASQI